MNENAPEVLRLSRIRFFRVKQVEKRIFGRRKSFETFTDSVDAYNELHVYDYMLPKRVFVRLF